MQVVCFPARLRLRSGAEFFAWRKMVGVDGVEPSTPRLSSACSNQLSYTPVPSTASAALELVELRRLELLTYSLQSYRSTN